MNGIQLINHPGSILSEILDNKGISKRELACKIHLQEYNIDYILNGKESINDEIAHLLEIGTGVDKSLWLNMQKRWVEELLAYFMDMVRKNYPNINMSVEYDKESNEYFIYHDYKDFANSKFCEFRVDLYEEIFVSNRIYNICFTYRKDVQL